MNAQLLNDKLELIQWLTSLEDKAILKKLIEIRKAEVSDWWEELSQEEKAEIELGLNQIENGELVSHENVMKRFEKWK